MKTMADFMSWVLDETGYEHWYQFMGARFQCGDFSRKLDQISRKKQPSGEWDRTKILLSDEEWDQLAAELKEIFPLPIMPKMLRRDKKIL